MKNLSIPEPWIYLTFEDISYLSKNGTTSVPGLVSAKYTCLILLNKGRGGLNLVREQGAMKLQKYNGLNRYIKMVTGSMIKRIWDTYD